MDPIVLTMGAVIGGALGYIGGQFYSPSARAYRDEVKIYKGRVAYLTRVINDGAPQEGAAQPNGSDIAPGLSGLITTLTTSGLDWKQLIPLVLKDPSMLTNILKTLQTGGAGQNALPNNTNIIG